MTTWTKADSDQFRQIWQRVQQPGEKAAVPAPPPPGCGREERILAGFLRRTAELQEQYRYLASGGGENAAVFWQLRRQARQQERLWQREWFLCTGECYRPGESCALALGRLTALRGVIRETRQLARDYAAAAEKIPELASLLEQCARQSAAAAERLCRVLEKLI